MSIFFDLFVVIYDFSKTNAFLCRPEDKDITAEDLCLLCDLFYLPFEHGSRSLQIINEFYWLKSNARVLLNSYKKGQDLASAKPEVRISQFVMEFILKII